MTEAQSHHEDVEDAASQEYEEDYNYQDWGVDRVDLDFKSGKFPCSYIKLFDPYQRFIKKKNVV